MFAARNMLFAKAMAAAGGSITFAGLQTSDFTNNSTSYATASFTPSANKLILAVVVLTGISSPPTLSGNGLTWVLVDEITTGLNYNIAIFRAMGSSPSAGALTVTAPATATSCSVRVVEFGGANTGGTNGSSALRQSAKATAASGLPTVTLAALGSGSALFAAATNNAVPFGGSPESGWTQDIDGGSGSPNSGLYTMYQLAGSDTTPEIQSTSGATWGMIAVEIAP